MAAKKRTEKKAGSSGKKHPSSKRRGIKTMPASGNLNLVNYVREMKAQAAERGRKARAPRHRTRLIGPGGAHPIFDANRLLPAPATTTAIIVHPSSVARKAAFEAAASSRKVPTTTAIVLAPRTQYRAGPTRVHRTADSARGGALVHAPFVGTSFQQRVQELIAMGRSKGAAFAEAMRERRGAKKTAAAAEKIAKKALRGLGRLLDGKKKRSKKKVGKKKTRASKPGLTRASVGKAAWIAARTKLLMKKNPKLNEGFARNIATKQWNAAHGTAASSKPGKKRVAKKKAQRHGKKKAARRGKKKATRHAAAPSHAPKPGKKRRGHGKKRRAKKTAHHAPQRTSPRGTEKFRRMHEYKIPPRKRANETERSNLRAAAGKPITVEQIMRDIETEKNVAWVCAGPRRTGCGGGSKMLRGGHQIGIFAVAKKGRRA